MPRKRQPRDVPPNQPYGRGQALGQMMQDGPVLPNGGAPEDMPPTRGATREQLLEMAQSFAGPMERPLNAPTDNPGEPVTAGTGIGPGPGPEVLYHGRGRNDRYATMLETIASSTNDPRIARLAKAARARA